MPLDFCLTLLQHTNTASHFELKSCVLLLQSKHSDSNGLRLEYLYRGLHCFSLKLRCSSAGNEEVGGTHQVGAKATHFLRGQLGSNQEISGCSRLRLRISETATRTPIKFYCTSCPLTTFGRSSERLVSGSASDHPSPTANEAAGKALSLHRPEPTACVSPPPPQPAGGEVQPPAATGRDTLISPCKLFEHADPRGSLQEAKYSEVVHRRKLF